MPAGQNSISNIGVRRMIYSLATPEYRNFEANGTQTYLVAVGAPVSYVYAGVVYAKGATIPYDAAGKYSNPGQLECDFNAGWIDPSN
jgi:hypothetical protein